MDNLEDFLIYIAIGCLLTTVSLAVLNKRQRETLFAWLPGFHRGRRTSTSNTPPRSLSPEKKVPNNGPPPVDYKETFPPSRREALVKAAEKLPLAQKNCLQGLEVDQIEFRKGLIPFTADYRECGPSTYTPTEISVEEIKALSDFPNYAELSGVPLPEAYKEFKIETALPRPYRPLRWAYHQTMCTLPVPYQITYTTD